ncbi:MAG: amino acid adenylation domain-containing protein [Legionella sp.]
MTLSLDNTLTFHEVIKLVNEQRMAIENKHTYAHDIFYRYPELAEAEHYQYPLALFIGTNEQCANKLRCTRAAILITISTDSDKLTWWIKESLTTDAPHLIDIIKASTYHFQHLFREFRNTFNQPISSLSLMDNEEYERVLNLGFPEPAQYPRDKTIHQLFEEQVERTPNNTAVLYGTKSLTYLELNHKANQLARCLEKQGVRPSSFVAICTTQELHLIIGILAILKTGAAYIPIDASYPKSHIHSILEDSKPKVLLASHHLSKHIEQDCDNLKIPLLLFSDIEQLMNDESCDNLDTSNHSAQSLAYIIYTSGTTGKPKGVMVPHRGVNRLVNNTNYILIKEYDNIAQAASISFDAATLELWGALLNGATLVAVPHAILLDPDKFGAFLERKNISILWLTSALFNQFAAHDPSIFRHLTYLLVGGDVLNKERIISVLECVKGTPKFLLNGYGPTENTTFTTTYPVTLKDAQNDTIPIGKPIANSFIYVLNEHLKPQPIGAIGELYTGGDGLAVGYLNRTELTQEKFILNPFDQNTESKLYKTGDSVRWKPDGTIEYLGRQDNQIKIRGFRVELEAIQTHLLHHNLVSQCLVRAETIDTQTKVLVAYIVCTNHVTSTDLQSFLKHHVPTYMIPSFFVYLDKMPLTPNGKVNQLKLPKPDFNQSILTNTYVAPSSIREQELASLWCGLLGCKRVGIEDDFFALGGHSLLLTQLIIQVKNKYTKDLPLPEFLENPTIKHLDQLIDSNIHNAPTSLNQNMMTDRVLPQDIHINSVNTSLIAPEYVLLTGSTGFLGAHLLDRLYQSTNTVIYCLIRGINEEDARHRLNKALSQYQLKIQCNDRIIPLLGDLSAPKLGLSSSQYSMLSRKIDVIIHNGAEVNHLYTYDLLRGANVNSTLELIAFAAMSKIKQTHYISTLSAASKFLDASGAINEDFMDVNTQNESPADGYSQTKWVSEQLLSQAASRGFPVSIYRPGWIVGQTHTGAINAESNHLLMLLKGCIQLKVAPNWDMMLDMLPVDTISNLIIENAISTLKCNHVFNLVNPNKVSWTQLIHYLNQRGYSIELIDPMKWKQEHLTFIDERNALYSLYPLYINAKQQEWMKGLSTISRANSYNTSKAFNEMGQIAPPISPTLLDVYFNYLEQQGFLSQPVHH